MKNYKVGDTIYVKGKIVEIDHDDTDLPYCVNVGPINGIWPDRSDIIDELPTSEPVKPALPEDVADELEDAKKTFNDFYAYLDSADRIWQPKTYTYVFSSDTNRDVKIKILSDAWYNGYTVEKPKLYNLILGTREDSPLQAAFLKITDWDDNAHISLNAGSIPHDLTIPQYQFTQEEIDKYNKNFWIKNIDLNDYKELVTDDSED